MKKNDKILKALAGEQQDYYCYKCRLLFYKDQCIRSDELTLIFGTPTDHLCPECGEYVRENLPNKRVEIVLKKGAVYAE